MNNRPYKKNRNDRNDKNKRYSDKKNDRNNNRRFKRKTDDDNNRYGDKNNDRDNNRKYTRNSDDDSNNQDRNRNNNDRKFSGNNSDRRQDRNKGRRFDNNKNFKKKYTPNKNRFNKEPVNEDIRLNKYVANSGICSRRQADEYIEAGHVAINGVVVTDLGTKVTPNDVVTYKGEVLKGEKNVYFILNKPKNYISTVSDPKERYTVMEFFKDEVKERIYPVGRLDRNTTGVLLFTNDGDLTKKLTHPSSNISKVYLVTLNKDVAKNDMIQMAEGIELDDGQINVDAVYYFNDKNKSKVVVDIHSGRNRIVRRIFEHFGYDVKNLDRIEFAGLTKKDLMRGQWRPLSEKEVGFLKMLSGKVKI